MRAKCPWNSDHKVTSLGQGRYICDSGCIQNGVPATWIWVFETADDCEPKETTAQEPA